MVHEDVALAHRGEDVDLAVGPAPLLELRRSDALPGRIAELAETLNGVDVGEIVQPDQPGGLVDLLGLDVHRLDELVEKPRLHVRGDLEPHDLAEAAAANLLLDRKQQVVGFVGDVVVGVPR